ncbi:MAG: ribosome silencing factor [Mogibacterium sp.]|nr:ribosome silencing factor [Mogibacterium sp.]
MDNHTIAREIAQTLSDRKAQEIVIIDIAEKSSFADYFVNCTAGSERLLGALQEFVEEKAASLGLTARSIEGRAGTGWLLIDYGDIIVNVFTREHRERYALDKIWGDCEFEYIEE